MPAAPMEYTEIVPPPALRAHVRCIWRLRGEPGITDPGDGELVIPDGCVEIVLNRGDRMRRLHGDGMVEEQPTRLLAGQLTRAISIAPTGRLDLVGIRFHPWAAASFVGVSGAELRDRMLPLDVAARLDRAMARAQEVDDDDALVATLIESLLEHLRVVKSYDDKLPGLARFVSSGGATSVRQIAGGAGLSIRRVQYLFADHVGMSPKSLMRIARFQRALGLARGHPARSWGRIAAECGYFDQAHLVRDANAIAGCAPSAIDRGGGGLTDTFITGG